VEALVACPGRSSLAHPHSRTLGYTYRLIVGEALPAVGRALPRCGSAIAV